MSRISLSASTYSCANVIFILVVLHVVSAGMRKLEPAGGPLLPQSIFPQTIWSRSFGGNNTNFGNPIVFSLPLGAPTPNDSSSSASDSSNASTPVVVHCIAFIVNPNAELNNYSVVVLDRVTGYTLWAVPIATIGFPGWISVGTLQPSEQVVLYCGTSSGVVALDGLTGVVLWIHAHGNNNATPARPTFISQRVFYTYENGHQSSPVVGLDASTGEVLYTSGPDEIAFTLIWPVASVDGIAYCSFNRSAEPEHRVSVTLRGAVDERLRWQHSALKWSPPGLWDNPNLDVDSRGEKVFMYSKPHHQLRTITAFWASNGSKIWEVGNTGSITDYDTYAWDGDFFHLMTVVGSNLTQMVVERLDGLTGKSKWRTVFSCSDPNGILLLGDGGVFVFGLSTGTMFAFTASQGVPLWNITGVYLPDNGITDHQGRLFYGDGLGNIYGVHWGRPDE